MIGISYFWFLGALYQMSILVLGKETLGVGDSGIGYMVTALAIGIGVGSIAAGRFSGDRIELGLVPVGSVLMGLFGMALGVTHSYAWAMVWLVALGFAGGLFVVPLNAFLQDRAGATEKGRVLAVNNFANMLGVILASGVLWLLHDRLAWRAERMVWTLGLFTLLATLYMVWLMPAVTLRFTLRRLVRTMFRLRVVGAEKLPASGAALLAANHVSFADAFVVGTMTSRDVRFLIWQPYFETRLLRPFLRLLETIPVGGRVKDTIRALRRAHWELENGEMVAIFPEGSLTQTGALRPFQRGFERAVAGLDAPVIPVYMDGLWKHPLSRAAGVAKNWTWFWRHPVTILIGDPAPSNVTAAELEQRMQELEARAMELRKGRGDTLGRRFIRAARKHWSALALADSTGRRLSFGRTLAAALMVKRWLEAERSGERQIGLLLPSSVGGAVANLGVALAGRTAVNLNFTAGGDAMDTAKRRAGARTILTARAFLEKAGLGASSEMVYLEDLLSHRSAIQKLHAALKARLAPASWIAGPARPDDVAAIIFSSAEARASRRASSSRTGICWRTWTR